MVEMSFPGDLGFRVQGLHCLCVQILCALDLLLQPVGYFIEQTCAL